MHHYYPATIVAKTKETKDSVLLTLTVPAEAVADFTFIQGQHVPVRAYAGAQELRRTYSICASATEQTLRLGVRVQEGGAFSNGVLKRLRVGDILDVMPPAGHFFTELDPSQSRSYAAFVAGSGITPILSIVKTTLETEAGSRFFVFYGNRKKSTTMFIEELSALKNRYPDRLSLHYIMSREETDIDLYAGRIDANKAVALHKAFLKNVLPDEIFICGPNPMIDEVSKALTGCGYDPRHIHSERFRAVDETGTTPERKRSKPPAAGVAVTVIMDGHRQSFHMEPGAETILDVAQQKGMDLPYSCKSGVCSTCRTFLRKGEVEMDSNDALESWEVEEGFILACQARPISSEIEIDYDEV